MKNMTEGEPLKLIIPFMIPLLIGNVFQQLYNIADIIIVGRTIGVNALAAVGATAPLFMMLVILTLGMSGGFSVVTGQLFGAGRFGRRAPERSNVNHALHNVCNYNDGRSGNVY